MKKTVRVRFAPSPTGFMHLGNARAALFNYLFAKQKKGTFVLRIEDTDKSRNLDEAGLAILKDLKWLGLKFDEGPTVGGSFGPYLQSERTEIYQKHLNDLIDNDLVYRCFCSNETLEEKRKQQIQNGQPPRYDRTCLHLSDDHVKQKIKAGMPFIWRFKLNQQQVFDIETLERGTIRFEMKNFSDFTLVRRDGSFTFLFTNFVDDWLMQISHVIRGEDHLTNTAIQAALFDAFAVPLPKFWHLPIICNKEGKKLSKRDFGFSLDDLKKDGFLPQAIYNYLAIIGGSFKDEIQSLDELVQNFDFDKVSSSGAINFDIEKLIWLNHKWIERLSLEELISYAKPFIKREIEDSKLEHLLGKFRTDIKLLKEIEDVIKFYFDHPEIEKDILEKELGNEKCELVFKLIKDNFEHVVKTDFFLSTLKTEAKNNGLALREIFSTLRYLLTGVLRGPSVKDIFDVLEDDKIKKRLSIFL